MKIPDLQTSTEVESAVWKQELVTGERLPNDPKERIEAYMNRLESVFSDEGNSALKERYLRVLRNDLIIKPENVPESYFELQQRVARERGQPVEEISPEMREQMINVAIEDQKASLDAWVEYLTSDDAVYPTWYKYFVFRNIVKLSQFDKERGEFKRRTDSTVAPFPDIYREPLAQICDIYEKVGKDNKSLKDREIREAFEKKFPTLYAELIQKSLAASFENKEEIRGEWIKFSHGNKADAVKLFESLEGRGTGWCTAGRSTAETQVMSGDFYVYYTYDENNNPVQPRIAIRMQGDQIGEVRGILPHQALEPQMNDVLEKKLSEFGGEADKYKKKSRDMRLLTAIENKTGGNTLLTRDELIFLYEIDYQIEGFGYQKDPRVEEIRSQRNVEGDVLVILECTEDQIAHKVGEVNESTVAYLGEWSPEVMRSIRKYRNIKHLYESFPDKKIFYQTIETDPAISTSEKAEKALKDKSILLTDWGKEILYKTEFSKKAETYELVRFTLEQLGFPSGVTTDEIYQKANTLGLELCPSEVGPHLRLTYKGGEWMLIAMKQITDRGGYPRVWRLNSDDTTLMLDADSAKPGRRWGADYEFVFRLRKGL